MDMAIIRPVSASIGQCELTHMDRVPICHERAQAQHDAYADALRSLGVQVIELPALHDQPDAVFVEDTAVVIDEIAVLSRPGAASRRGEVTSMKVCIEAYRPTATIEAPGTLEGGDVIHTERTLFVGLSSRTNQAGFNQLQGHLQPHGWTLVPVPVPGALHLKTAAVHIGRGHVLANPDWIDTAVFTQHGLDVIHVDPDEPFAGNGVLVHDTLVFGAQYPRTIDKLAEAGFKLLPVQADELAKAEGSLTCKSVLFRSIS